MKKWLSILLTFALTLGCAISAQAAVGDVTLIEMDVDDPEAYRKSVISIAVDGDTLYALSEDRISVLKAGESTFEPYVEGLVTRRNMYEFAEPNVARVASQIFVQNGQIVALDSNWGALFTISADANGQPVYGDVIDLEFDEEWRHEGSDFRPRYLEFGFENCVLQDNILYVAGYDYDGGEKQLYIFDATTGKQKELDEPFLVQNIGTYRDGKLLMISGDFEQFFDRETGEYVAWPLNVYDPASGEVSELARISGVRYYDVRALCYDEAADIVYMVIPNRIFRVTADGTCELAAYHPYTDLFNEASVAQVFNGQVALFDYNGNMALRTCDPAQLPKETLSIAQYYSNDAHKRAAALMQDIPIFFERDSYFSTAQELGQALAAGENQLDIIAVNMSWIDYSRLVDKGYCYELSGSQTLMDYVKAIYPLMSEPVMKNGKLYGVPIEMNGDCWTYNAKALETLGLPVPTTWPELVEVMNTCADEEHEEWWEEYSLFEDEGEYKAMIMYQVMSQYEQYMLASGKTLSLDTPEFRTAMQAVEQLDTENVEVIGGWDDDTGEPSEELEALWNKTPLFRAWGDVGLYDNEYTKDWKTLKLTFGAEESFQIPLDVRVLFVNPRSQNLHAAVLYLENLVKSLDQRTLTSFMPELDQPIENRYYETQLKDMITYSERLKAQLEKAEPIDKPALQEALDSYQGYIEEYKQTGRYEVTEKAIAKYRDVMQYAVLRRPSVMYSNSNDDSFWTLRSRYAEGQITLEQFIQEGSGKLRLMQMENQ